MRKVALYITAAGVLLLLSCTGESGDSPGTDGKVKAFVSLVPQAYFVERIGGEYVSVGVMVGPGQSPHSYDPTPRQIAALSRARIYFSAGVPFEDVMLKKIASANENIKIIDSRKGIALRELKGAHHDEDDGKEDHLEHLEGELDPHFWLDPKLAKVMAKTICEALVKIDPGHADEYRANLDTLAGDLDSLDAKITKALAPLKGRKFYVFHPAFGYFGASYGLVQTAVETGGKEPGPKRLAALIGKAKADGVKVIFVQAQFSKKTAETIAKEIGGTVVPIDPLAKDYLKNLESMAEKISGALQKMNR
jgi:zinc transport system substrate-binding protein